MQTGKLDGSNSAAGTPASNEDDSGAAQPPRPRAYRRKGRARRGRLGESLSVSFGELLAKQSARSLPDADDTGDDNEIAIELRNAAYYYGLQPLPALDDVSLKISPGEIVHVTGRCGSGKSTLARMLAGHLHPSSGTARIGGLDLTAIDPADQARSVMFVSDETPLVNGPVSCSIASAFSVKDAESDLVVEACELVGAHELIQQLPLGYRTWIGAGGYLPSSGFRQLLVLASALIKKPAVLIMDEAVNHIDDEMRDRLRAGMARIAKNRTLVVVAKRPDFIVGRRRTVLVEGGRVLS